MDIKQKNELLSIYANHFGNNEKALVEYSIKNSIINYQQLIEEFKAMEGSLFNYIWKITEPNKQLSGAEIEVEAERFCASNFQWVNKIGLKSLIEWLIWMCWHEGILKK